jgi:hypothetical protein
MTCWLTPIGLFAEDMYVHVGTVQPGLCALEIGIVSKRADDASKRIAKTVLIVWFLLNFLLSDN